MNASELSIVFEPLLPWPALAALGGLILVLLLVLWWQRARGAIWRTIGAAGLLLGLANPNAVQEQRQMLNDHAVVVVDESPSQAIGERRARTEAAVEQIRERLRGMRDLDVRVTRAPGASSDGTRLYEALDRALADVPRSRLAAAFLITDGQVHDVPAAPEAARGPIHALITGERNERDRRLIIESAPSFAIVGRPVQIVVRVDDGPDATGGEARITVQRDGGEPQNFVVPVGRPHPLDFTLERGGQSLFELIVEPGRRELTLENNRAVVAMNGVRDRLRVLLVTGEPHPGERTWRTLLKSDPAVDLIHFTILRPPEAQDFTPVSELSLIAFPIRELFEVRLNEFDLIIFDRYRRRDVLAPIYLENIARYVRRGGALMIAVGPQFNAQQSLFNSPLGAILPGQPTGANFEQGYRPNLSDAGRRHPVTADLPGAESAEPRWGRWFRHVDAEARRGQVLMAGANARPLLILDRVGEGRVAQLQSDHIWLWARGFEGGGPHAELLRRIAHWLMKEPELEENDLRATVRGPRLEIVRRALEPGAPAVEVTTPAGVRRQVQLTEGRGGRQTGSMAIEETGLYRVSDGVRSIVVVVGPLNPVEFADVRATEERLRPAVAATGGAVQWLVDGMPELRRVRPGREMGGRDPGGRGWLGLRANQDYVVTGVSQLPLMPGIALFLLALGGLLVAWRREGR